MGWSRGWLARFLRWFRGDNLDDVLAGGAETSFPAGMDDTAEGAVSGVEAAALSGVGTAVLDGVSPPLHRRFITSDGDGDAATAPETVDEGYVLSREAAAATDQVLIGAGPTATGGVTVSRIDPRPEAALLAKVDDGVAEITRVLQNVNTAAVQQTEALQELAKPVRELPAALRAQGVYLETLIRQVEAQNARSAEVAGRMKDLPAFLKGLSDHARAQVEFLQRIAGGIEEDGRLGKDLVERVTSLQTTLAAIGETGRTQVRVLENFTREQAAALDAIREASARSATRHTWLIALAVTGTVVTVGGFAWVLTYLTRLLPAG